MIQTFLVGEAVARGGFIVLVADDEMRFLAVSDGACETLGYTRTELLQLSVPDIVADADAAERYEHMVRTRDQRGRITLVRKDGAHVEGTYEARETRVSGMQYFVSIVRPLDDSAVNDGGEQQAPLSPSPD
jgi:PAS domain S-box-containing protein